MRQAAGGQMRCPPAPPLVLRTVKPIITAFLNMSRGVSADESAQDKATDRKGLRPACRHCPAVGGDCQTYPS